MADAVIRMGYNDAELQRGLQRSASGVRNFASQTRGMLQPLQKMFSGGLGAGMGALGLTAGVAGAKALVNEFDRLGDLANQLGTSAETMQRLGAMAKLSGSAVEGIARAMNRVNKEIAQGKADEAFAQLGIETSKYLKLDADEQLLMLAQAFQEAEGNGRGLAAAYDLFGKNAGELLPLLRGNVDQLKEAAKIKVISEAQMRDLQDFNDEFDKLSMNVKASVVGLARYFREAAEGWGYLKSTWAKWNDGDEGAVDRWQKKTGTDEGDRGAETNKRRLDREKRREASAAADAIERGAAAAAAEVDECEKAAKLHAEIAAHAERAANAAKRKAEEAKREQQALDKARDSRLESIRDLEMEMKILEARAGGNDKRAAALEREARIQRDARDIAKQLNLGMKEAMAIAEKKAALEDRIEGREVGRKKIQGYSRAQRDQNPFLHKDRLALDDWREGNNTPFFEKHQRPRNLEAHPWQRQGAGAQQSSKTMEQKLDMLIENTAPIKDY